MNQKCGTVALSPGAVSQGQGHQIGAGGNAEAVETVQIVHVAGAIVESNVVVQTGINGTGT